VRVKASSQASKSVVTLALGLALLLSQPSYGQILPTTSSSYIPPAYAALRGRTVEDVRVLGNQRVPSAVIQNVVRTKRGDKFDPTTVEEDYRSIYALRKFANAEAKVEPTVTGVIVTFIVTEEKQIREITYRGNQAVTTETLRDTVTIGTGEAIDSFRINTARQSIESLYRDKNFPFVHVEVDREHVEKTGELVFNVVEGPKVTIRKVKFLGNRAFTDQRLKDTLQTKSWFPIFRPGTFDPEQVEDDVASVRRFYESKGFFDVQVGRTLAFSPDQTEMQVNFVVNEGVRYRVSRVEFRGNSTLSDVQLRRGLRLIAGRAFDAETAQRDIRQIVREYSPFGYIYESRPQFSNPEYLKIEPRQIFHREAGTLDLIYQISEGKPFRIGRILIKGNARTQDKVILRELRIAPGQMYNSAELADGLERVRGLPNFSPGSVSATPIGNDPNYRDILIEVNEQKTAMFTVGAGVNSNGGVGAAITYTQSNFDITDWPESWKDIFTERAFTGAGQLFRVTLQPGTEATNASVLFREPWIFDQRFALTTEAYYRDRLREHYDETRAGGRVTIGHRFDYVHTLALTFRGEDVNIHDIDDDDEFVGGVPVRAPEILALQGHSTITSAGLLFRRDTSNPGPVPYRGTISQIGWESYGALGGEFTFQKFTGGWDWYHMLHEDLVDRRTVLAFHIDAGYIPGDDAPFFERFYGGGIGSIRGFRFRGVSPRDGFAEDPIGGNFSVTGTAEVSFPLYGDSLRGVVFTDFGDVEEDVRLGTIRSSVGAGIRLVLPIFGQTTPIALDFAMPITKDGQDDTQIISFSLGFNP
jgi:outer membrane protein insertion porin family